MTPGVVPEEARPPCHYVLAEGIDLTDGRIDAQVVVACDHDVQSHHWFTRMMDNTITCEGCREVLWRPHARAYRFLDGKTIEP